MHRQFLRWWPLLALTLILAGLPAPAVSADSRPAGGLETAPVDGFVLPVPAPPLILMPFAPPANRYGAGHRGVDLAAPAGSVVRAAGDGVVVYSGALAGRGVVSVEHGGLRTTYEPVTGSVAAGTRVAAGEVIGALEAGHGSCVPASCLHWGARLPGQVYLDPMSLLRPWTVRLWPWEGR